MNQGTLVKIKPKTTIAFKNKSGVIVSGTSERGFGVIILKSRWNLEPTKSESVWFSEHELVKIDC